MVIGRPQAAALGVVADRIWGEPRIEPHPVAAFGRVMRNVERRLWRDGRLAGAAYTGVGVGLGAGAGVAAGSTAVACWLATAGRGLAEAARSVAVALDRGDVEGARLRLPTLVGRDPTDFDEKEIVRAVVESVAENTVDAVVAPVLWAALAGAPGALGYRAVNTLDAMVGHRSERYERFGWASARLDDAAGWVPARVTAVLTAAVRPAAAGAVLRTVRVYAGAHPSPNAGVAETAFAAALGLRLGGESRYGDRVELRPSLGDGRPPERADIDRALRLSRDVSGALAGLLSLPSVLRGMRWCHRRSRLRQAAR